MADDCEEPEAGAPAWMATFADMMSLLLCFFVLMLSFATMDVMKFEGMIGSMKDAFGVKRSDPGRFVAMKDSLIALFSEEAAGKELEAQTIDGQLHRLARDPRFAGSVEVLSGKGGVTFRIDGDLVFQPGNAQVHPTAFVILEEMAAVLRQFDYEVSVQGHTDATKPGVSYPSNFNLSAARALAVLNFMVDVGGIPPKRLRAVAFGDTKPIRSNDTPEGRNKNRRVEFFFHKLDNR